MSSSTAKFVPTLGGRVWRLQQQGALAINSAIKSASGSGSSTTSFAQKSSASYSTSTWGQCQKSGWKNNNGSSSWSQRQ